MDEEAGKKMFEMQIMENKLKQLDQQLNMIEQQITQDQELKENLKEMAKKDKFDLIFPIGGGIFVKGSLEKMDKVIVNVGSGVMVEKKVEEAKEFLIKRRERFLQAKEELGEQVKELIRSIPNVGEKLEK